MTKRIEKWQATRPDVREEAYRHAENLFPLYHSDVLRDYAIDLFIAQDKAIKAQKKILMAMCVKGDYQ